MQLLQGSALAVLACLSRQSIAAAVEPRQGFEEDVKYTCSEDLNAFDPVPGKFVVHYTSSRDSAVSEPWIRVCYPRESGDDWHQSGVLLAPCSDEDEHSYSPQRMEIGGSESLIVSNGFGGCDNRNPGEQPNFGDLEGAYLQYNGLKIDLMNGGDHCGPRSHGISCEFSLAE